jgi:flagellar biogenesis protein FliO
MDIGLIKSLLGVIVTLAVLGFFAFYLKRMNQISVRNKFIKIKELCSITTKIKLAIIEVGDEPMLFSISEQEIKLIKKMPSFEKALKQHE